MWVEKETLLVVEKNPHDFCTLSLELFSEREYCQVQNQKASLRPGRHSLPSVPSHTVTVLLDELFTPNSQYFIYKTSMVRDL